MITLKLLAPVRIYFIAAITLIVSVLFANSARAQTAIDPGPVANSHSQVSCATSPSAKITTVSDPGVHTTTVDFPAFEPVPLLTMNFTIAGTAASCVAAHFSVMQGAEDTYGRRLWTMYRVEIDGVPMQGHFPLFSGPLTVGHTADQDLDMVSYNFWQRIGPGAHTIRVLFSGYGGSGSPGAIVVAPVLTVERK